MERDQSPELIANAGAAIGDGLADLGKGIGAKLQTNKNQREETDFLRGRYETLSKMAGQDPDDKFYGKSLGAQRAEVLGLEMSLNRQNVDRTFTEGQRRFDASMGLKKLEMSQDAAFKNEELEYRKTALDYNNESETPFSEVLPDGTRAMGVTGDKSGRKNVYNMVPPARQEAGPYDIVPLQDTRITSYGYDNDPNYDSNSAAGIGAFVPLPEQQKIKAGQDSAYKLRDGDVAVSPDIEALLRKQGIKPFDEIMIYGENGGTRRVRWTDRTSPKLSGRVDFYTPKGTPQDDGGRIKGFSLVAPAETPAAPKAGSASGITWHKNEKTGEEVPYMYDQTAGKLRQVPVESLGPMAPKETGFWDRMKAMATPEKPTSNLDAYRRKYFNK